MPLPPLHLRKYYFDLLCDDGRAFVWHWTALRWPARRMGPIRLRQAGELAWDGRVATSRSTVRCCPEPEVIAASSRDSHGDAAATTVRWRCSALGIDGAWHGPAGASVELLPERPGAVRWHCLQPRSNVEVHRGQERLHGIGYAERLDLDIAPWRLPIDILRWGRLSCGQRSVVWIGWHGPRPLTVVLVDGVAAPSSDAASVGDALVAWPGGRIALDDRVSLRDERIGDALGGPLAALRHLLPRRVVHARESRWLSQARWMEPPNRAGGDRSSVPLHGVAMHERVEFALPPPLARGASR